MTGIYRIHILVLVLVVYNIPLYIIYIIYYSIYIIYIIHYRYSIYRYIYL